MFNSAIEVVGSSGSSNSGGSVSGRAGGLFSEPEGHCRFTRRTGGLVDSLVMMSCDESVGLGGCSSHLLDSSSGSESESRLCSKVPGVSLETSKMAENKNTIIYDYL